MSETGNKYLLTAIDSYVKFPEVIPLPNKQATTVSYALRLHIFARYCPPVMMMVDQGREFLGECKAMLEQYGVTVMTTAGYSPQSNGQVERFNRTLETAISKKCESNPRTWDQCLPDILMRLRTTAQSSTSVEPYKLLYARDVPNIVQRKGTDDVGTLLLSAESELAQRQSALMWIEEKATANIQQAKEKQARDFAGRKRRADAPELSEVGTMIYVKKHNKKKLEAPWEGPYELLAYNENKTVADVTDGKHYWQVAVKRISDVPN